MFERYKCPHCGVLFYETPDNTKERRISFLHDQKEFEKLYDFSVIGADIVATYHYCPSCREYSVQLTSSNELFSFSYPPYTGITLPDYIPEAIRKDYMEACAIIDSSPKASATLSRRCLQGMIRDFWGVQAGRNRLDPGENSCRTISRPEWSKAVGQHWGTYGKGCEPNH